MRRRRGRRGGRPGDGFSASGGGGITRAVYGATSRAAWRSLRPADIWSRPTCRGTFTRSRWCSLRCCHWRSSTRSGPSPRTSWVSGGRLPPRPRADYSALALGWAVIGGACALLAWAAGARPTGPGVGEDWIATGLIWATVICACAALMAIGRAVPFGRGRAGLAGPRSGRATGELIRSGVDIGWRHPVAPRRGGDRPLPAEATRRSGDEPGLHRCISPLGRSRLRACAQHRPRSSRHAPAARRPAAQGATPQLRRRREV